MKSNKAVKKVSAKGAGLLAQFMKNKGKKPVDAEDVIDKGADEDKE